MSTPAAPVTAPDAGGGREEGEVKSEELFRLLLLKRIHTGLGVAVCEAKVRYRSACA